MFSQARTEDHDGWVRAALAAVRQLSAQEVGEAFLASLTSRRLDLRSALGSYAVARFLPEHSIELPPGRQWCLVCGQHVSTGREPEDMNVLSFERFKRGGVRTDHIEYAAFDLEQFAPGAAPAVGRGRHRPRPAAHQPDPLAARRHDRGQAVGHLKMIKGNKAEREIVLGILGVCGILQSTQHPGYSKSFIRYCDRELPARRYVDQDYPACWWTAGGRYQC